MKLNWWILYFILLDNNCHQYLFVVLVPVNTSRMKDMKWFWCWQLKNIFSCLMFFYISKMRFHRSGEDCISSHVVIVVNICKDARYKIYAKILHQETGGCKWGWDEFRLENIFRVRWGMNIFHVSVIVSLGFSVLDQKDMIDISRMKCLLVVIK